MLTVLALTAICYVIATFFRIREKVAGQPMKNHSRMSLLAAIFFNLQLLYVFTDTTRHSAEFSLGGFFIIGALSLAMATIFIELLLQESYFSAFSLPICLVMLLMSLLMRGHIAGDHFSQPWFLIHLIAAITGECFFLIAAISGATYLFVVRRLKSKNKLKAVSLFPPLTRLDSLTYRTIMIGTLLFLIGLGIGLYGNMKHFAGFSPVFKHYFSVGVMAYYGLIVIMRQKLQLAGPRLASAALLGLALSVALVLLPDNHQHWLAEQIK